MRITRVFCCTLLLTLFSLAARAATVVIDRDLSPGESVAGASFDADLRSGQAWVVVDFLEHGGEEEQIHSQRLTVPGLTYDVATRTIHLQEAGGGDVTCAVGRKVLWATRFRTTPQCSIHVQQVSQAKVYGGDELEKTRFKVEFGTAPAAP